MNAWVKDVPVGTTVLCRTDHNIVAIKFGTPQGYGQSLWETTEGKVVTDFIIQQSNPQRLYLIEEIEQPTDRYEEGFEDGYLEGRLDERLDP